MYFRRRSWNGRNSAICCIVFPFSLPMVKYFHRKQEEPLSQTRYLGRVTRLPFSILSPRIHRNRLGRARTGMGRFSNWNRWGVSDDVTPCFRQSLAPAIVTTWRGCRERPTGDYRYANRYSRSIDLNLDCIHRTQSDPLLLTPLFKIDDKI